MAATVYTAKVIGTDPKTDLALIKVDGKNTFRYEGRRHQTDHMARRVPFERRRKKVPHIVGTTIREPL